MSRALYLLLRFAGVLLFWSPLRKAIIWLNRRTPKVLLYHACEPRETAFTKGLNSVTSPEVFVAHLDYLTRHYTVVDVLSLEQRPLPDRTVIITFDDGYRSVYQHAFPALRARRLPATVYLVTSVVGNRDMVWVNELNWMLRNHPAIAFPRATRLAECRPDATPEYIIARLQSSYGRDAVDSMLHEIRTAVGIRHEQWCGENALYVTWDEVASMAQQRISFGSHSDRHPSLPHLTPSEARADIQTALDALRDRVGAIMSFAYPFGHATGALRRMLTSLGYSSLMEVGGSNAPLTLGAVARVPMAQHTVAQLFAEMEVVSPIKGWASRVFRRRP